MRKNTLKYPDGIVSSCCNLADDGTPKSYWSNRSSSPFLTLNAKDKDSEDNEESDEKTEREKSKVGVTKLEADQFISCRESNLGQQLS